MTLREQLLEMAEAGYRAFTMPLMPGVEHVIGIRIPILRKMAKEIARGDWRTYLSSADDLYFEERLLQGLVVGYAKCTPQERLEQIARFVPKIDNWAVCDSFCMRKLTRTERLPTWEFIQSYFRSTQPYDIRFAVVTSLSNFIDEEYLEAVLGQFATIRNDHYYVRMAIAWAVSVCFVRFPERTEEWLTEEHLDVWTHNKSIQKIRESLRIDADTKLHLASLRRREEKSAKSAEKTK